MELDVLSFSLMLLRFWIILICYLGRLKIFNKEQRKGAFCFLLGLLLLFLVFRFTVNNYLVFYFMFECALIPVLFLVLGWGYQPERAQAGIYLIFYTIVASLPLLVLILRLKDKRLIIVFSQDKGVVLGLLNIFLVLAFLVKFPIYMAHLWLLKAHVEAPAAGSIILAGVLLKLGGYGIIRFIGLINIFPFFWQLVLIRLSLWGGVLMSLNCLGQRDIKLLIASSSVVHIRSCVGALLCLNEWGYKGCVIIIVAHGLCSSCLFFLVRVVYGRTGRRSLNINKGLLNIMPSIRLWWFLLLAANLSAPPTINLLGEVIIITRLVSWNSVIAVPILFLTFFSGAYSVYLFSLRQHGKYLNSKQRFHSGLLMEYFIVIMHWLPLNLFILCSFILICFFSL